MSKQIAVRLPDDIVEFVDGQVREGNARSRAGVVTRARQRERRRAVAPRDAAILAATGPDPDMDELAEHAARIALELESCARSTSPDWTSHDPSPSSRAHSSARTSSRVTVAPITATIRGLSTEPLVGRANGLDAPSVVSCDNIVTVPTRAVGEQIGVLLPAQEHALSEAIHAAFDLDDAA